MAPQDWCASARCDTEAWTVTFARRRTLKQVLKFGHACAELWDSAMDLGNTRLIVSILAGGGEMGVGVAAQ